MHAGYDTHHKGLRPLRAVWPWGLNMLGLVSRSGSQQLKSHYGHRNRSILHGVYPNMETSSRSGNIISRFSAAVLLGIALLWSLSAAPTMAQEKRDPGAPVQPSAATPTMANRASTPVQSNTVALPVNQVSTPEQQKPASSATNT